MLRTYGRDTILQDAIRNDLSAGASKRSYAGAVTMAIRRKLDLIEESFDQIALLANVLVVGNGL